MTNYDPETQGKDISKAFESHSSGNLLRDPELEPQNYVWAADVMSLKFAADVAHDRFGAALVLPSEVASDPEFADLTTITIEGRKVSALIDTGFLKWLGNVSQSEFTDYRGTTRQASQIKETGYVAAYDGAAITNALMHTEKGQQYMLWVAETDRFEVADDTPTRYGLIRNAQQLMEGYYKVFTRGFPHLCTSRKIPAVSADWHSKLPEIVEANARVLEDAEQTIKLRLDYTGARAMAETVLTMRGGSFEQEYVFGSKGPVTYWFTSKDGNVPFAVCKTTSQAWLTPDQSPDFDITPQ